MHESFFFFLIFFNFLIFFILGVVFKFSIHHYLKFKCMFNHIMHLRLKKKTQIKCSENREQGKPKIKKKKVSLDKAQKRKKKKENVSD